MTSPLQQTTLPIHASFHAYSSNTSATTNTVISSMSLVVSDYGIRAALLPQHVHAHDETISEKIDSTEKFHLRPIQALSLAFINVMTTDERQAVTHMTSINNRSLCTTRNHTDMITLSSMTFDNNFHHLFLPVYTMLSMFLPEPRPFTLCL